MIDPGFTTLAMDRAFRLSERASALCRFESGLAAVQAELGIIPADAADDIARACALGVRDPDGLFRLGWELGTPVVALLEELRPRMAESSARWLHHGATSQDALDTATMLQVKEGLAVLDRSMTAVARLLAALADTHRATPFMGRTLLQDAVPTSFGAKAASWLSPVVRHRSDLARVSGGLPVQLGGPVGDGASFGEEAFTLADRLADALGLAAPTAPWHADRAPITEVSALAGRIASSMAKIGTDLILLAQSALGEVAMRPGVSSAMPHKRNPIDAVRAVASAAVCHANAAGLTGAAPHELERSAGSWQAEWVLVPLVFQAAAASVEAIGVCLETLEVRTERMAAAGAPPQELALIDRVLEAHARLSEV